MIRRIRTLLFALLLVAALPLSAATRVTLSQDAVQLGGSVVLTIETDQPVASPDLAPLGGDFRVGGIDSARQIRIENGGLRTTQEIRIQLKPLRAGLLKIPALAIGNQRTAPLLLEVLASGQAPSAPARASSAATDAAGPVFVETVLDDDTPYVQQAVGVSARLYYAVDLYNGDFRQPEPSQGGSLQPVGQDSRSLRVVGGRQYQVLERHYLLIPERSGVLRLPGATFNGEGESGFLDGLFGNGRDVVSTEAPARTLRVKPIPAGAGASWLPARKVTMAIASPPDRVPAGEAFDLVVELRVDGATAAQLPELRLEADGAQVFAEPAQPAETFADGRPQVVLARRFSVVPQQAGELRLRVAPIAWWDVAADAPRSAGVQELRLQVLPGVGGPMRPSTSPPAHGARDEGNEAADAPASPLRAIMVWAMAVGALAAVGLLAWLASRHGRSSNGSGKRPQAAADENAQDRGRAVAADAGEVAASARRDELRRALAQGDLLATARLLPLMANPPAATLGEARARLADVEQADAMALLERALWGAGDADAARSALSLAFARGPEWRAQVAAERPLLPPLYPES